MIVKFYRRLSSSMTEIRIDHEEEGYLGIRKFFTSECRFKQKDSFRYLGKYRSITARERRNNPLNRIKKSTGKNSFSENKIDVNRQINASPPKQEF